MAAVAMFLSLFWAISASAYNEETKKGWWWYETIPDAPATQKESLPSTVPDEKKKKFPRDVTVKDVPVEELWNMHPDDFQELFTAIHKKAVQYPDDPQAMNDYYKMTDTARRKALAFANSSMAFLMKNPEYDMNASAPLASPGRGAATRMQTVETQQIIWQNRDTHALVYFWQPGCQFCDAQDKILKYFIDKYEWTVKKVNIKENPAAAETFAVTTTPTILLIAKGNQDYLTVGVGVVAASEIETKVYRGMRMLAGEDPTNYSTYEYQKEAGQDVKAPLKKKYRKR